MDARMTAATTARAVSSGAPGPKGLPILGSVFPAWKDPLGFLTSSHAAYGDVVRFKFGPWDYYLVADPEVVHHVLLDNAKAYRKSRNYQGLKIVLGEGLLISEGEQWRKQRKLTQPAFHRSRLSGFADHMSQATRSMLDRWRRPSFAPSGTFDIHEEMMRLTFRIVGLTLLSADVDGDAREVGRALDTALHWANDFAESIVRIPPYVPTPANLRLKRAMKTLDGMVYRIIEERRAKAKSEAAGAFGNDLLGMLMESVDEDSARMNDQQLRDEIITMILAGHETTANLLSWTFMLLAEHPEIERKIREEALRVLGAERDPKLDDVRSLEYTRMVLDEALRMYPPAWMFERQNVEDDVLGGYPIKAGSIVGIAPYVIHRHPKYWPEPEKFDPERFASAKENRPRYTYLPFGGGARSCIGNHFAMMEAQIILAMIVRQEHIELDKKHPIEREAIITLRPKHGIRVARTPFRA